MKFVSPKTSSDFKNLVESKANKTLVGSVVLGAVYNLMTDSKIVWLYFGVTALIGIALKILVRKYDKAPGISLSLMQGIFYFYNALNVIVFCYLYSFFDLRVFAFPEILFLLLLAGCLLGLTIFVQGLISEERRRINMAS
jgi:hypothetical protein